MNSSVLSVSCESQFLMRTILVSFLLSLNCLISFAQLTQWEPVTGLYGGRIKDIIKKGDTIVVTASSVGLIRSFDNGITWIEVNQTISKIALAGEWLFCMCTDNRVYRSKHWGDSLEMTYGISTPADLVICMRAITDSIIMIATIQEAMYRTDNLGNSWDHVCPGGVCFNAYYDIASKDSIVYALRSGSAEYISYDYGATFTYMSGSPNHGMTIAIDSSLNMVLLGTSDNGVYTSSIGGSTWQSCDPDLAAYDISSVAFNGTDFFAGTASNGVFISQDAGAAFTPADEGLTYDYTNSTIVQNRVNEIMVSDSDIFLGTDYCGLYHSTNNAASWERINVAPAEVKRLSVMNNQLMCGNGEVFYGDDNGMNWAERDSGILVLASMISVDSDFIISTSKGAFITHDKGITWLTYTNGLPANQWLRIQRGNDTILFAQTDTDLYVSTDNGQNWSWNALLPTPNSTPPSAMIDTTIYFTATFDSKVYFKSIYSSTWSILPGSPWFFTIFTKDSNLYGANGPPFAGIWYYDFTDQTWHTMVDGLDNDVFPHLFVIHDKLFNYNHTGTYVLNDSSKHWQKVADTLDLGDDYITDVVESGGIMYAAAGYHGLLKMNLTQVFNDYDIWPGDADNNGMVDNTDILALGLGYGQTGPQRNNSTIFWNAQYCDQWNDSLPTGVNLKFTDCNGDGVIEVNDTLAISENYNLTHPLKPQ